MDIQDFKNLGLSLVIALLVVAFSYIVGELSIRPSLEDEYAISQPAAPEPKAPPVAAKAPEAAPAPAAVEQPAATEDVGARIAAADPAMGEKAFRLCKSCHTADKDGKNRVGPKLWDVVGRKMGSVEGFKYSDAFGRLDGDWTYKQLDTFLKNLRIFVVGTRMSIKGMKDAEQRANLIAYLRTLSDAPRPLP